MCKIGSVLKLDSFFYYARKKAKQNKKCLEIQKGV